MVARLPRLWGMHAGARSLGARMQIALIGTGKIGGTLGQKWREAGHEIRYGSRNPRADGPGGAPVVTVGDAIEGADVVVFAIPGPSVAAVAAEHGAALAGKVVIDATNRMGGPVVNNRAEIVEAAPDAHYVRAFNSLGWENFAEPLARRRPLLRGRPRCTRHRRNPYRGDRIAPAISRRR